MSIGIFFDADTSVERLVAALKTVYGIDAALVYVGPVDGLPAYPGPDPIVTVTPVPGGGQFAYEFGGGDAFAEIAKTGELEVAIALCRTAATRALVDEGSSAPDYWFLVARDGSYGRVLTASDTDVLSIEHALEPITGEPDLPVVPPPDWARTW